MNDLHNDDWQATLDRLVDDELSPAERAACIARAEREPAGWRDVALRFLEEQEFRRACRSLQSRTNDAVDPQRSLSGDPAIRPIAANDRSTNRRAAWSRLAAACAAVAAMVWGVVAVTSSHRGESDAGRNMAIAPSPRVVRPSNTRAASVAQRSANSGTSQAQFVVMNPGGEPQQVMTLPVVTATPDEWRRLASEQPKLPSEIREQIERQGLEVHERRTWWPVRLTDGRDGFLPIDEVQWVSSSNTY